MQFSKAKIYKTTKYTLYYLLEDAELPEGYLKKIVRGGHEFYFYQDAVVIKPLKAISRAPEAPSTQS